MGKASRRRTTRPAHTESGPEAAPFVARPFEGLASETEWVALREILPAATGQVSVVGLPDPLTMTMTMTMTMTTVLPLAWPALNRNGGDRFVATQSGATSGDASRDIAAALLLAVEADEGSPVTSVPTPTAESPRLQDILDPSEPFAVTVHGGFDYWVGDTELDADGRASLERANESVIPTERVDGGTSVYWCVINGRSYVRWVLPYDEDAATVALARLHSAGRDRLTPESRLLGAFRAGGLLVPVWEVPTDATAADFGAAASALGVAIEEAAADPRPLDADERRARAGLLNRQVTLR